MKIRYLTLEESDQAAGLIVVIDVLRAFSTACYAFGAGASDITLVGKVEEAFSLREQIPGSLTFGEVRGLNIDGFDFGNSPSEFLSLDLRGRRLIQRTSSGTQGIVRAKHASILLASSFCCAEATVRFIDRLAPEMVTFLITGITQDGLGDEDLALADYLSDRLNKREIDPQIYLERVTNSKNAQILRQEPFLKGEDVDLCSQLDRFPFALQVSRESGRAVMRKVYIA